MPGWVTSAWASSMPGAVEHVHHSRGQRRGERRAELQRGQRNRRGQLDDRRVARGQRRCQLRHHHRQRPIERNDKRRNAVGLPVQPWIGRLRVDALGRERRLRHRPEYGGHHRCGVDLEACLGEHLAVLAGEHPRAVTLLELLAGRRRRRHDLGDPLADVNPAPPSRRVSRRGHRRVELGMVAGRGVADDLGGPGRVVHRVAAGGAGLQLTADREQSLQRRRSGHDAPPLDPVRSSGHRKSL